MKLYQNCQRALNFHVIGQVPSCTARKYLSAYLSSVYGIVAKYRISFFVYISVIMHMHTLCSLTMPVTIHLVYIHSTAAEDYDAVL